jgi:hypothetical protein
MFTVVLIGTVALVVAIVGCFFIWRLDASRAEEVEHTSPPPPAEQRGYVRPVGSPRAVPRVTATPHQPKHLDP